ncbi:hypothetical protein ACLB2K_065043 [Fragaria x ananassa]
MSIVTDELRAKADELYHGDAICQDKSKFLLTEMGLPNGLLPMKDMMECGYHVGRLASYATEITAYVEKGKIKKVTGVKTKELMVWVSIGDIFLDDPPTGKITFKSPTGLFRTFPVSAFELDGPDGVKTVEV